MADETSTTSQNDKSWYSEITWKQALIVAALSFLFGGSGGGFVATKTSSAQGISQDQADVRYLKTDDADKRDEKRDKREERIEGKIDSMKDLLNQILVNQKSGK